MVMGWIVRSESVFYRWFADFYLPIQRSDLQAWLRMHRWPGARKPDYYAGPQHDAKADTRMRSYLIVTQRASQGVYSAASTEMPRPTAIHDPSTDIFSLN